MKSLVIGFASLISKPESHRRIAVALALCTCTMFAGVPSRAAAKPVNNVAPQGALAKPGPGFAVKFAEPGKGIEGQLRGAGSSIFFRSQKFNGVVSASILRADSTIVYQYREFNKEMIRVQARDGSRIALPRPPELRVQGVLYGPPTPERLAALNSVAISREGDLIRRLGLELVMVAPGRELVDERRGLELATQALWSHFKPDRAPLPPLTMDYEVSSSGYVVLTQPAELVLATNHTQPELLRAKHDDDAVNGCFGRCGSGCTGGLAGIDFWPSHWNDSYGPRFAYQQEIRCITGEDWIYTYYATPITHSVDGAWTPGCQLHDNCCLPGPLVCYTVCNALLPVYVLNDPQLELRTWTYTDYSWSVQSYNAGYSGCTCPGMSPFLDYYECTE
jgi:hypothetical protein